MPKITEYPKVTALSNGNVLLVDGNSGTKGILAENLSSSPLLASKINVSSLTHYDPDLKPNYLLLISNPSTEINGKIDLYNGFYKIYDAAMSNNTASKRSLYRGRSLGTTVSSEQYEEIHNGTFHNMFLGDYWDINGIRWVIVDFNYWYGIGPASLAVYTPHVVVMPNDKLYLAPMTDLMSGTITSITGYYGTKLRNQGLSQALLTAQEAFGGNHLLSHPEFISNNITYKYDTPGVGGSVKEVITTGAWYSTVITIPNEIMITGKNMLSSESSLLYNTDSYNQLAAMSINKNLTIAARHTMWLRDIDGISLIANKWGVIDPLGVTSSEDGSVERGVFPVIAIC